MANQHYVERCAVGDLVILGTDVLAFTKNSDVYIPAGAIITGIRYVAANTAVTVAAASATIKPMVGTAVIGATLCMKTLPAQTVALPLATDPALGMIVMTAGELNIVGEASNNATAAGTWKYYVDYLYVPE